MQSKDTSEMVIKEQIYEIMRAILYIIYIIKCKGNLL